MAVSHLAPDQLAELRSVLERELEKLERSMRVTDEAMRPVELDQSAVGRLSRMDSLQNQGLTRNLQGREQVKLGLIIGALRRIEDSSYGRCTECGSPVPFERLLVFPEAPTCAGCAT